jgi:hypothetical protein
VVEQMRTDRKEGVHRVSVLTINDAARYLGLSRSGVEKLITAGKLRLFTIAPTYRDEKPAKPIPPKMLRPSDKATVGLSLLGCTNRCTLRASRMP